MNILLKIILISLPLISTGCDKIKFDSAEKLRPVETYSLKISEPSGLVLHNDKLWIVSDQKSEVYMTDLGKRRI
jgi:hypothetical protein